MSTNTKTTANNSSMLSTPLEPLVKNQKIPLINAYDPNKIFVLHSQCEITQYQFLIDVELVVRQLPDAEYVINLCEDRYYFLVTFCALLIKKSINLLPPNRQLSTLQELVVLYPNTYCIDDKDQVRDLKCINVTKLLMEKSVKIDVELPYISAQQIAAIAFTSGSTGVPKPILKSFGTLAATARMLARRLMFDLNQPSLIATVPSQHMYGLETTIMMVLQSGIILHSEKPFYPHDIQQRLQQTKNDCILVTTPIHLRALVHSGLAMPHVARIISATAPLDINVAQDSETIFKTQVWEIFGCTEAGSMATRCPVNTQSWRLLDGFALKKDVDSELVSVNAPHLTESAIIQDHIEVDQRGDFLLMGRNADMINVAGKRASLAQLTTQLLRIPGVVDGVIFLPEIYKKEKELRPVALVVSELSEKEILGALSTLVDAAFLPRPLLKVESLPRNETGKLTASILNSLWSQLRESE